MSKWKIGTAVAIILVLLCVSLYPAATDFAESIIGSPDCVIAADYNSLTYNGQRYVPLPMDGVECSIVGGTLVEEAQVEGAGFWGKLFFGEKLFKVGGDIGTDIVYLQSDYDALVSPYFVLESQYDIYAEKLKQAEYDVYCGVIWQEDDTCAIFELEEQDVELLAAAEQGDPVELGSWGEADWNIAVCAYESERIFNRMYGEVICAGDSYYWSPYEYSEMTGTVLCWRYYKVDGELFENN